MKLRYLFALAACLIALQACEDDPILMPAAAKAKGGSYGRVSPPVTPNDSASSTTRAVETNPQIF
jgi:hypothetical protein